MMKSSTTLTLFLTLLFLSFSSPLSAKKPKCHPHDQKAVTQIKTALGIKHPFRDCCDPSDPISECHEEAPYRVFRLTCCDRNQNSFYSNFSGPIPAAVGDLPYLEILNFNGNPTLSGPIPQSISKLSKLFTLILSSNRLSGPIPTFLGNLKNLTYIDLSYNSLSGSIPELSKSVSRYDLILSNNNLTGTIPKSFGSPNFYNVDLSYNNLVGDGSIFLGKNKTIVSLHLYNNRFMFNLSNVEFPETLTDLRLGHNKIFGSLPQQLTQLDGFFLDVSYNKLCGKIPQGGDLQTLDKNSYVHNKCLCGAPLPACK